MPGWTEKPWLEIRAELEPMTRQDRWITDGNYSQVRDLIWPRADTTHLAGLSLPRHFLTALHPYTQKSFSEGRTLER